MLDIDYKHETKKKDYWTVHHRNWLDDKIKTLNPSANLLLKNLIVQLESTTCQIETFEAEIEHLAGTEFYKNRVDALLCFKGIQTLTAMTIISEIFDINRFDHPKRLVSFMGLDIGEYSSGGKQIKFGITKVGNKYLRTPLVEANQKFGKSKTPTKRHQQRRNGLDPEIIAIADRCQARLYTKGHRLLMREKQNNKVKVAMAREMVGFIWEALKKVS